MRATTRKLQSVQQALWRMYPRLERNFDLLLEARELFWLELELRTELRTDHIRLVRGAAAASDYAEQFYEKFFLRIEEPGDFPDCLRLQANGPVTYLTVYPRLNLSPIPTRNDDETGLEREIASVSVTEFDPESDENKENLAPNS